MSHPLPDHAHPIATAVRRFVETEVLPVASSLEHADAYPHDLVARMRALGLFGALIPEAHGGLGLSVSTYARVIEELCGGFMSLAGVINTYWAAGMKDRSTAARLLTYEAADRIAAGGGDATASEMARLEALTYFAAWTLNRDWEPARVPASGHQTLVPAQNFRTADGWIVVFCAKEKFWLSLVRLMGLPALASDPRFDAFPSRLAHRDALLPILEERFATKSTREWLGLLRGHVPCAPVNSVREALEDAQVLAREMIVEIDHPVFGRMRQVASPIKTEGAITAPAPAPRLGEHTDTLLQDVLGYGAATIERLRAKGVIA